MTRKDLRPRTAADIIPHPPRRPKDVAKRLAGDIEAAYMHETGGAGVEYLIRVKVEEPKAFLQLMSKLIPKKFEVEVNTFNGKTQEELEVEAAEIRRDLEQRQAKMLGTNTRSQVIDAEPVQREAVEVEREEMEG